MAGGPPAGTCRAWPPGAQTVGSSWASAEYRAANQRRSTRRCTASTRLPPHSAAPPASTSTTAMRPTAHVQQPSVSTPRPVPPSTRLASAARARCWWCSNSKGRHGDRSSTVRERMPHAAQPPRPTPTARSSPGRPRPDAKDWHSKKGRPAACSPSTLAPCARYPDRGCFLILRGTVQPSVRGDEDRQYRLAQSQPVPVFSQPFCAVGAPSCQVTARYTGLHNR